MSGSNKGSITQWNDANGDGLIDDVYVVSADNCTAALLKALRGHAIPPGKAVAVTFDFDVTNQATDVDLALGMDIAASAED